MKIIGITGTSGSGKGYVCGILRSKGYTVIDSDALCHDVYENDPECIKEIGEHFPSSVVAQRIDRAALRKIVFSDKDKLEQLNSIAHKYILRKMDGMIAEAVSHGCKVVFVDAPQLFEAGLNDKCNSVVSVIAPYDLKIKRIIERDGINKEAAETRLLNQHNDKFFISNSDFIINNDGKSDISYQITKILTSILGA